MAGNGHWSAWKIVGWLGNAVFFTRFIVQWYATEKRRQVVVPPVFWWLSLTGSLLSLSYAIFHARDAVFIFAYALAWIPYVRNLIIHYRHENALRPCPDCGAPAAGSQFFCGQCGARLSAAPAPAGAVR